MLTRIFRGRGANPACTRGMTRTARAIALLLPLTLALQACGLASTPPSQPAPSGPAPTSSAPAPAKVSQPASASATATGKPAPQPTAAKDRSARIYFSSGDKLVPETAKVQAKTPAKDALDLLVAGPHGANHYSEIPKGSQALGVNIKGDIAYANMNQAFFSAGGSTGMLLRLGQVVFTLTQFPPISSVQFLDEGKVKDVAGGEGFPLNRPLARKDFPDLSG